MNDIGDLPQNGHLFGHAANIMYDNEITDIRIQIILVIIGLTYFIRHDFNLILMHLNYSTFQ